MIVRDWIIDADGVCEWDERYYFADKTKVSRSMLEDFRLGKDAHPLRYKGLHIDRTIDPSPPTAAMKLGTLIHAMVLEDTSGFVREPVFDKKKAAGKRAYAEFVVQSAGKRIVSDWDWEIAEACRESLMANPVTRLALTRAGENERVITWVDPETGLEHKARLDRFTPGMVVDLKSTQDPNEDAFMWHCIRMGYHRQGAFYLEGSRNLGNDAKFILPVVRTSFPYETACYEMSADALELGVKQNRVTREKLLCAMTNDDWRADHEIGLREIHYPPHQLMHIGD